MSIQGSHSSETQKILFVKDTVNNAKIENIVVNDFWLKSARHQRKKGEIISMSDKNQVSQEAQGHPEGTLEGDPNIGEAGVDKVLLRVEGQNENITTPPKEVQADIAATAQDIEDVTMGIEDAS